MMNGSALPAFRDSAATHQPRLKCGGECPVYDNHLDEVTDRSWPPADGLASTSGFDPFWPFADDSYRAGERARQTQSRYDPDA